MERVLFVDACMRGPALSRTHRLCRRFLEEYTALHPGAEVMHRDLTRCDLPLLTWAQAEQRDELSEQEPGHPLLAPAREMADADLIVVGAPCWDLSFPAALKVYLEWASVKGVTFRYTREGQQLGLARAGNLVYVTTAGGPVAGQNYGYDYVRAIAAMLGVEQTHCVAAEGLDIWGADQEAALCRAERELAQLAARL